MQGHTDAYLRLTPDRCPHRDESSPPSAPQNLEDSTHLARLLLEQSAHLQKAMELHQAILESSGCVPALEARLRISSEESHNSLRDLTLAAVDESGAAVQRSARHLPTRLSALQRERLGSRARAGTASSIAATLSTEGADTSLEKTRTQKLRSDAIRRLAKPHTDLQQEYVDHLDQEASWVQRFASSVACNDTFQTVTLIVILVNFVWIGVDMDLNRIDDSGFHALHEVMKCFFVVFFMFEAVVRLAACKDHWRAFKYPSFVFDFSLMLMILWEVWLSHLLPAVQKELPLLRLARVIRLMRVARLARILRSMPELTILMKGILAGLRSMLAAFVLFAVVIYAFAMIFRQTADSDGQIPCFGDTVMQTAGCLLHYGVFPDQTSFLDDMKAAGGFPYALSLLYFIITTITLMNMLVGIFCEMMSTTAELETFEVSINNVKHLLVRALAECGIEDDWIDHSDCARLILETFLFQQLHDCGVDIERMSRALDDIFAREDRLPVEELYRIVFEHFGESSVSEIHKRYVKALELEEMYEQKKILDFRKAFVAPGSHSALRGKHERMGGSNRREL